MQGASVYSMDQKKKTGRLRVFFFSAIDGFFSSHIFEWQISALEKYY